MAGRWPALEERVLAAVAEAGAVPPASLPGRLETMSGNEWIVEEAVADLVTAGALREDEGSDGTRTLRPAV